MSAQAAYRMVNQSTTPPHVKTSSTRYFTPSAQSMMSLNILNRSTIPQNYSHWPMPQPYSMQRAKQSQDCVKQTIEASSADGLSPRRGLHQTAVMDDFLPEQIARTRGSRKRRRKATVIRGAGSCSRTRETYYVRPSPDLCGEVNGVLQEDGGVAQELGYRTGLGTDRCSLATSSYTSTTTPSSYPSCSPASSSSYVSPKTQVNVAAFPPKHNTHEATASFQCAQASCHRRERPSKRRFLPEVKRRRKVKVETAGRWVFMPWRLTPPLTMVDSDTRHCPRSPRREKDCLSAPHGTSHYRFGIASPELFHDRRGRDSRKFNGCTEPMHVTAALHRRLRGGRSNLRRSEKETGNSSPKCVQLHFSNKKLNAAQCGMRTHNNQNHNPKLYFSFPTTQRGWCRSNVRDRPDRQLEHEAEQCLNSIPKSRKRHGRIKEAKAALDSLRHSHEHRRDEALVMIVQPPHNFNQKRWVALARNPKANEQSRDHPQDAEAYAKHGYVDSKGLRNINIRLKSAGHGEDSNAVKGTRHPHCDGHDVCVPTAGLGTQYKRRRWTLEKSSNALAVSSLTEQTDNGCNRFFEDSPRSAAVSSHPRITFKPHSATRTIEHGVRTFTLQGRRVRAGQSSLKKAVAANSPPCRQTGLSKDKSVPGFASTVSAPKTPATLADKALNLAACSGELRQLMQTVIVDMQRHTFKGSLKARPVSGKQKPNTPKLNSAAKVNISPQHGRRHVVKGKTSRSPRRSRAHETFTSTHHRLRLSSCVDPPINSKCATSDIHAQDKTHQKGTFKTERVIKCQVPKPDERKVDSTKKSKDTTCKRNENFAMGDKALDEPLDQSCVKNRLMLRGLEAHRAGGDGENIVRKLSCPQSPCSKLIKNPTLKSRRPCRSAAHNRNCRSPNTATAIAELQELLYLVSQSSKSKQQHVPSSDLTSAKLLSFRRRARKHIQPTVPQQLCPRYSDPLQARQLGTYKSNCSRLGDISAFASKEECSRLNAHNNRATWTFTPDAVRRDRPSVNSKKTYVVDKIEKGTQAKKLVMSPSSDVNSIDSSDTASGWLISAEHSTTDMAPHGQRRKVSRWEPDTIERAQIGLTYHHNNVTKLDQSFRPKQQRNQSFQSELRNKANNIFPGSLTSWVSRMSQLSDHHRYGSGSDSLQMDTDQEKANYRPGVRANNKQYSFAETPPMRQDSRVINRSKMSETRWCHGTRRVQRYVEGKKVEHRGRGNRVKRLRECRLGARNGNIYYLLSSGRQPSASKGKQVKKHMRTMFRSKPHRHAMRQLRSLQDIDTCSLSLRIHEPRRVYNEPPPPARVDVPTDWDDESQGTPLLALRRQHGGLQSTSCSVTLSDDSDVITLHQGTLLLGKFYQSHCNSKSENKSAGFSSQAISDTTSATEMCSWDGHETAGQTLFPWRATRSRSLSSAYQPLRESISIDPWSLEHNQRAQKTRGFSRFSRIAQENPRSTNTSKPKYVRHLSRTWGPCPGRTQTIRHKDMLEAKDPASARKDQRSTLISAKTKSTETSLHPRSFQVISRTGDTEYTDTNLANRLLKNEHDFRTRNSDHLASRARNISVFHEGVHNDSRSTTQQMPDNTRLMAPAVQPKSKIVHHSAEPSILLDGEHISYMEIRHQLGGSKAIRLSQLANPPRGLYVSSTEDSKLQPQWHLEHANSAEPLDIMSSCHTSMLCLQSINTDEVVISTDVPVSLPKCPQIFKSRHKADSASSSSSSPLCGGASSSPTHTITRFSVSIGHVTTSTPIKDMAIVSQPLPSSLCRPKSPGPGHTNLPKPTPSASPQCRGDGFSSDLAVIYPVSSLGKNGHTSQAHTNDINRSSASSLNSATPTPTHTTEVPIPTSIPSPTHHVTTSKHNIGWRYGRPRNCLRRPNPVKKVPPIPSTRPSSPHPESASSKYKSFIIAGSLHQVDLKTHTTTAPSLSIISTCQSPLLLLSSLHSPVHGTASSSPSTTMPQTTRSIHDQAAITQQLQRNLLPIIQASHRSRQRRYGSQRLTIFRNKITSERVTCDLPQAMQQGDWEQRDITIHPRTKTYEADGKCINKSTHFIDVSQTKFTQENQLKNVKQGSWCQASKTMSEDCTNLDHDPSAVMGSHCDAHAHLTQKPKTLSTVKKEEVPIYPVNKLRKKSNICKRFQFHKNRRFVKRNSDLITQYSGPGPVSSENHHIHGGTETLLQVSKDAEVNKDLARGHDCHRQTTADIVSTTGTKAQGKQQLPVGGRLNTNKEVSTQADGNGKAGRNWENAVYNVGDGFRGKKMLRKSLIPVSTRCRHIQALSFSIVGEDRTSGMTRTLNVGQSSQLVRRSTYSGGDTRNQHYVSQQHDRSWDKGCACELRTAHDCPQSAGTTSTPKQCHVGTGDRPQQWLAGNSGKSWQNLDSRSRQQIDGKSHAQCDSGPRQQRAGRPRLFTSKSKCQRVVGAPTVPTSSRNASRPDMRTLKVNDIAEHKSRSIPVDVGVQTARRLSPMVQRTESLNTKSRRGHGVSDRGVHQSLIPISKHMREEMLISSHENISHSNLARNKKTCSHRQAQPVLVGLQHPSMLMSTPPYVNNCAFLMFLDQGIGQSEEVINSSTLPFNQTKAMSVNMLRPPVESTDPRSLQRRLYLRAARRRGGLQGRGDSHRGLKDNSAQSGIPTDTVSTDSKIISRVMGQHTRRVSSTRVPVLKNSARSESPTLHSVGLSCTVKKQMPSGWLKSSKNANVKYNTPILRRIQDMPPLRNRNLVTSPKVGKVSKSTFPGETRNRPEQGAVRWVTPDRNRENKRNSPKDTASQASECTGIKHHSDKSVGVSMRDVQVGALEDAETKTRAPKTDISGSDLSKIPLPRGETSGTVLIKEMLNKSSTYEEEEFKEKRQNSVPSPTHKVIRASTPKERNADKAPIGNVGQTYTSLANGARNYDKRHGPWTALKKTSNTPDAERKMKTLISARKPPHRVRISGPSNDHLRNNGGPVLHTTLRSLARASSEGRKKQPVRAPRNKRPGPVSFPFMHDVTNLADVLPGKGEVTFVDYLNGPEDNLTLRTHIKDNQPLQPDVDDNLRKSSLQPPDTVQPMSTPLSPEPHFSACTKRTMSRTLPGRGILSARGKAPRRPLEKPDIRTRPSARRPSARRPSAQEVVGSQWQVEQSIRTESLRLDTMDDVADSVISNIKDLSNGASGSTISDVAHLDSLNLHVQDTQGHCRQLVQECTQSRRTQPKQDDTQYQDTQSAHDSTQFRDAQSPQNGAQDQHLQTSQDSTQYQYTQPTRDGEQSRYAHPAQSDTQPKHTQLSKISLQHEQECHEEHRQQQQQIQRQQLFRKTRQRPTAPESRRPPRGAAKMVSSNPGICGCPDDMTSQCERVIKEIQKTESQPQAIS